MRCRRGEKVMRCRVVVRRCVVQKGVDGSEKDGLEAGVHNSEE